MANTTYVDFQTPAVNAAWLNDLNNFFYLGTALAGVTYSFGVLSYTDTGVVASFASTQAGYNQVILQNKSNAANASTNWNVSNDQGTATTNYGEFGINSSAFTGVGSFNQPGNVYLAAASSDLVLGTYGSHSIHFVVNNGSTDAGVISSSGLASFSGVISVVDSIALLRSVVKTTPGNRVFVTGYYTAGDGGGGQYYYNPTDTTSADNGGTIIVAADGGRWYLMLQGSISVKQFGATGNDVTDDTAAIQAAHDAIVTGGKARVLQFQNGATYKITNTIYIDVSLVSLSGDGATIDISAVPTGVPAVVFASSGTNGPSQTQALVTRGFRFVGSSVAGQICHQFGTLTNVHGLVATTPVPSVTIAECGFINIDICDQYVTQAIDIKHALCEYESCGASSEIINIPAGGTNYGENLTYSQCSFRNGGTVLNQIYTSSQINFSQCTFDYCTSFLRLLNGYCIAENCYFEMSADTLNHFVAYNDSLLILINPVISVTTNRVNTDIFVSNTNLSTGFNKGQGLRSGIFVQGGSIAFQAQNNRPFLCTGTGACEFVGIDYSGYALSQSATQKNCISAYTNLVNNGAFNANITGWTVVGGVTWNSTGGNGGGGSLQLNYTVDPTNAYIDFFVERGQSVIVTYDVSTALASRFMQASILLFDYDGNQLATSYTGSVGEDEFTGTNAYTTCQTRYCNAPQGTAKGRFFLSLTGGAVAGCIANIDNVYIHKA